MTSPDHAASRFARVAAIAEAFVGTDAVEVRLTDGAFSCELTRRSPSPTAVSAPHVVTPTLPESPEDAPPLRRVVAPLVGVLRFVEPWPLVGARLAEEREIAVIEALGVRTPVLSGGAGRIHEVSVVDGQPVEYGQQLFVIVAE